MDKKDERWIRAELEARDRATEVAQETLGEQLKHLNNLREQAVDKEFYFREHEALSQRIDADIDTLEERMGRMEGRLQRISGTYVGYAAVGAIFIAAVSAIVAHLISG